MKNIKKLLKQTGWWLFFLFGYVVILMLLNYTRLFTYSTIVKFNYICVSIILLIFGILTGRKCDKKGYIEGIKLGSIISIALLILNIIFLRTFSLKIFLYYILIIISFTIGSIIGINLKKAKK